MQLYILPLGGCCCNYEVIAPGIADGKRIHIPVPAFLIRLDDDSLVLVDTGMSRLHIADPDLTWRGTPLAELLVPDMRREDSLLWRLAELDIRRPTSTTWSTRTCTSTTRAITTF